MTGSLQPKKNGYWYVVLSYKNSNGEYKQKWESTGLKVCDYKRNNRKLVQKQREIIAVFEEDKTLLSPKMSFADCVSKWLEVAETTVRSNTYETYKVNAHAHVIPYFKQLNVSVQKLEPIHLQDYFTMKIRGLNGKKGLSPNTIAKHKTVINEAIKYAIDKKLIRHNPMNGVRCPARVETAHNYYNASQLHFLFQKTKDSVISPAIMLAAKYGLRRSEVLALTWSAVDFKEKTISIEKTIVKVGTSVEERDIMKSRKSRRTFILPDDVNRYLLSIKEKQENEKILCGDVYNNNDFICKWADGTPIKPDYVSHEFKHLIELYDLPPITFHELRHSSASLLINNGFSLKEVQEWLGHSNYASTCIYAHLEYKSKERMTDKMSEILSLNLA